MSRRGGGSSGLSLAFFSSSSNFFESTWLLFFSASKDFWKASSRRPASPLSRWTAAARSSMGGGLTASWKVMTACVSGSTFRSAWQHGHFTSNMPLALAIGAS